MPLPWLLKKFCVADQIRKGVLNGVALKDAKREEFNKIEQQLRKLCRKFDENIMDATRKFEKLITDKTKMEGLSPRDLDLAAQTAVSKGYENATVEDGPWVITLDEPNYHSFVGISQNGALREEIYRACATQASSGDTDNTLIIDETLKLRLEKAKLLGYDNYVEVSMATKMATIDKAEEFLEKLRSASWDAAVQEMEDLKQFSKNQGAKEADDLSHWDIAFWTGRLLASKREEHYIASRKNKLRVIIQTTRNQNVLMRIKGQNNVMIRAIVTSTSGARCCLKQKMISMRTIHMNISRCQK